MIYFIREGFEGNIKIGYTAENISKRKSALQTGNSKELIIIGTMSGNLDFETYLKGKFQHCQLVGEWFSPKKDLLEYIDKNVQFHQEYVFYLRELAAKKARDKVKMPLNSCSEKDTPQSDQKKSYSPHVKESGKSEDRFSRSPDTNQKIMAHLQDSPSFLMSNEYLDALRKVPLAPIERQILDTIMIHTWGNNPPRKEAVITNKDFMEENMIEHHQHVSRAIIGLLDKNMIVRTGGNPRKPIYSLQKDYEKWRLGKKNPYKPAPFKLYNKIVMKTNSR